MRSGLSPEAQQLYDELANSGYIGTAVDTFVAQHGEAEFIRCAHDYFHCGEEYGFEAVDAFIEEFGIELFDADHFLDGYMGEYGSKKSFAKELAKKYGDSEAWQKLIVLAKNGEVDWNSTFDGLETYIYHPKGFVFSCNF